MPNGSGPTALETGADSPRAMAPGGAAAFWERTASDADFRVAWLHRQCMALTGTRAGVVLQPTADGLLASASWPPARQPPPELTRIAERAAIANRPVIAWVRRPNGNGALDLLIGLGIRFAGAIEAVIAVAIDVPDGIETVDPDALADRLHLGSGWLEARLFQQRSQMAVTRAERAAVAMDIVAVASVQRRPSRAGTAVVNELAIRLRCDRVSLGLTHRAGIKLKALSHVASFQERGRVVDAIGNAMEECLAQSAPVAYPPLPLTKTRIAVAHRDLAKLGSVTAAVASVVLPGPDGPVGVLTFERHADAPFDAETLLLAEAAGALLGPVMRMQVVNDRMVSGRLVDTVHDAVTALLGRDKPSLKLAAIAAIALLAVLCVVTGEYRVTERAVLEGEVQRAAVVPFDGFVAASSVRPGDHVRAGDLLAAMDDRDLVLERARAWADTEKLRQKYHEAMAKHDRSNTAMLAAQIDQAEAQLAIAEDKLQRSRIVSPIDGLLVSGDLSQILGSPIERGKTLFEIAPLDQYRVVLRTDERDLQFVSLGQHGQLALAGMPGDRRPFTVTRITPIAEAKDGRNEFRVEGILDEPPGPGLRPGMEGVAKVETGSHHLVWVWTHGIVDWLRLTAWKWLP